MPATQNSVILFARSEKAIMVRPEGTVVNFRQEKWLGSQVWVGMVAELHMS